MPQLADLSKHFRAIGAGMQILLTPEG